MCLMVIRIRRCLRNPKPERDRSAYYTMGVSNSAFYDMIYLLTAIGLSPGGSSTVHMYTQTMHRTTQITTERHK